MEVILRKRQGDSPYSFVFKDNGKVLIKSETYKSKSSALKGIESVKKNCQIDSRYEIKKAKNGKFYFNIKAANGQIVGTSTFFNTEEELKAAIEKIKKEAPSAPIREES